jgi:GT2 family glycosyltransferase
MKTVYLALGKFGDIACILPIIHEQFKSTGQIQNLMVAKKYAGLLDGCSYIKPIIFDGDFSQLFDAYKLAKQTFDEVICLQVSGKDFPFQHTQKNFQQDQWHRAGMAAMVGRFPLVFDRRSKDREEKLLSELNLPEKFILVADKSESSPFQQVDDLLRGLNSFGLPVFMLSGIWVERLYDLLAVYEKATVIVSTETAHLHLTAATKTPVIALATDKPSLWHGTLPHNRFAFHCYYGEYAEKKNLLMQKVKQICDGKFVTEAVKPTRKISCVIPIYKPAAEMLSKCISSVINQVNEIVLTMEAGGVLPDIVGNSKIRCVVHPKTEIGFGANVNFGVKHAKYDTVLILNDDVYLDPFAVEEMEKVMDEKTAIVGMLTRYPNGMIYHSGKVRIKWPNVGHPHIDGIGVKREATIDHVAEMENTNGASILVNKTAFDEVCGFDESIKFYTEDDDLCMKVRQAGWKIMYTPFATGIHDGHRESQHASFDRRKVMAESNAKYIAKWKFYFELNKNNPGLGRFK